MPRYAFSQTARTLSRGIGIRYIHLPPRMLPVSMPQSRRTKIMPITPVVIRYTNRRRTYCDDLSGDSSFSGNRTNDFDNVDNSSSSTSASETSTISFWNRLPDYTSTFQTPQMSEEAETTSLSRSTFSDEDLEMINQTAAVTAAAASSANSPSKKVTTKIPEDVPRIIQKTVGEIAKDIKFPDSDAWADASQPADSTTRYMT
ncbi:uncharacterized protein DFL_009214 [Arthrobotrys flagrans]|uniref:Uncharacterized protein n=1 Tax=Arthrobotrys flagrans TaxID=97331 RepID=A0A436ZQZ9_ARTFL|nr:hypothetical protein DFL_009214 [Arthrobotrys flagrans]